MSAQSDKREFTFTAEEASAVARCELGVGELPMQGSLLLGGAAAVLLLVRAIRQMPFPPLALCAAYLAAGVAWVLFLLYIRKRLALMALELQKRRFALLISPQGLAVYEYGEELRFRAEYSELAALERGQLVYRFSAPMGRICVPMRLFSAAEAQGLAALPQAKHSVKSWM